VAARRDRRTAASPSSASSDRGALALLDDVEIHRRGFGLLSRSVRGRADWSLWIGALDERSSGARRSCSCAAQGTCVHLRDLGRAIGALRALAPGGWEESFGGSPWTALLRALHDGRPAPASTVRVENATRDGAHARRFRTARGDMLADFLDPHAVERLEARLGLIDGDDRGRLLERLAVAQETALEAALRVRRAPTERRVWEESFWHRLAYHCVRTYGSDAGTFEPHLAGPGDLRVLARVEGRPVVELAVAPERAAAVLDLLARAPGGGGLRVHPTPFDPVLVLAAVSPGEDVARLRAALRVELASGTRRLIDVREIQVTQAGSLVYVPELGLFGRRAPAPPVPGLEDGLELRGDEILAFLEVHRDHVASGRLVIDDALDVRVIDRHEGVTLRVRPAERGWTWVAASYRFGEGSLALAELLRARRSGRRFLRTADGWIDLRAASLSALDQLMAGAEEERASEESALAPEELRLSAGDLLRLRAASDEAWQLAPDQPAPEAVAGLLELRPVHGYQQPAGLRSVLREYQRRGVEWLLFLWENGLGGLLCDDMGLGKTHQAFALMALLVERFGVAAPMLVVAPTSVISHWRNRIRDHAPSLRTVLHHGTDRQLGELGAADVVLTSYGVMRRDIEELKRQRFAVVVFDEIQSLKNRGTLTHRAARSLRAEMRVGLTGTPVENSLDELVALVDVVATGYLPAALPLRQRLTAARGGEPDPEAVGELQRVVSPIVLRRLKASVLDELPEKIEDPRTCALSPQQAEQYRTAVAARGGSLLAKLERESGRVPYLHVFALLNLLKQICDHPALALGQVERYREHESGKWNLFEELLEESLGGGHKVVVFTQYLGMVAIISRHLDSVGVGHVTLTGASRERGELVDRFNRDPDCRVFVGSLKAGGTGIDLIGGSVVIHYDQWWNAAREDQATDRVHRIGQRRAVQVFKLITEGTLEEKIAAIVERKRRLLAGAVAVDDPTLAKVFTREELIELIRPE
jgi:superfamily II DNA or RNA helicase